MQTMDKMTALVQNAFGKDPNVREFGVSDLARNALTFRQEFLRQFGDPRRDLNQECGYPYAGSLTPSMYYALYEREPIANRAVRLMPMETWKVTPSVVVGDGSKRNSPLEKAWDALPKMLRGTMSWYDSEIGSPIWDHLKRTDILSGIGRFGVVLLGFDDGLPLDVPVGGVVANQFFDSPLTNGDEHKLRELPRLTTNEQKAIIRQVGMRDALQKSREARMGTEAQYFDTFIFGEKLALNPAKAGKRKLLFMRAYPEHLVDIVRWESDPTSPRFNMPLLYRITLNDPREQHSGVGLPMATVFVHWSRLIHIADNTEVSEVYATPRIRPILNPVLDVQKVRAGSGEMFWRGAFPGLSFETNPQLGGDVPIDRKVMREEYQNYMNSLERAIVTSGMVVKTLTPATTDPTPYIAVFMEAICICLGCPVRVFKGSERGELASAQDDQNWDDRVRERQNGYVTPRIVVPFVDRLIATGVLPDEDYRVEWPDLESIGDAARAAIAVQKATAISTFVSGNCASVFPERGLYTELLGFDEDKATAFLDERDKDQKDDLADSQDVADEHGFIPTPPPGFKEPPPKIPALPANIKPPGLKPAIPPVKPGVANFNPTGVNQYSGISSKAARNATNKLEKGEWTAASHATKGLSGNALRDAHRIAANLHLKASYSAVGEQHKKHMTAYTFHAAAAAEADDRASIMANAKRALNYNQRWPQSRRDKLPSQDFAGPHQSFPIDSQKDVDSAARLLGHADRPKIVKRKIIKIAKRKGLRLPDAWTENWKQPPTCPECGAKMDGKVCGKKCGFSWRGTVNSKCECGAELLYGRCDACGKQKGVERIANMAKCPRCKCKMDGQHSCSICGMQSAENVIIANAINISDQAEAATRMATEERSTAAHEKAAKLHYAASVSCANADDADWHDSMAAMHKKLATNAGEREYVRDEKGQFATQQASAATASAVNASTKLGLGAQEGIQLKALTKRLAGDKATEEGHDQVATGHRVLAALHREFKKFPTVDKGAADMHEQAAALHEKAADLHEEAGAHHSLLHKLADAMSDKIKSEDLTHAADEFGKQAFLNLPKQAQLAVAGVVKASAVIEHTSKTIAHKTGELAQKIAIKAGLTPEKALKVGSVAMLADMAYRMTMHSPFGPQITEGLTNMTGIGGDALTEVFSHVPAASLGLMGVAAGYLAVRMGVGAGLLAAKAIGKAVTKLPKAAVAGLTEGHVANVSDNAIQKLVEGFKENDGSIDWAAHICVGMDHFGDWSKALEFANANCSPA